MRLPDNYVKVKDREHLASLREGRVTSSQADKLLRGTEAAWQKLSNDLLNPPPYHRATHGPMAKGVEREAEVAALFAFRNPGLDIVDNVFGYHINDPKGKSNGIYRFVGFSPDRIVRESEGKGGRRWVPLEVKNIMSDEDCQKKIDIMKSSGRPIGTFEPQILWHAWCSGTARCYLAINSPSLYEEFLFRFKPAQMKKVGDRLREFVYQHEQMMIEGSKSLLIGG